MLDRWFCQERALVGGYGAFSLEARKSQAEAPVDGAVEVDIRTKKKGKEAAIPQEQPL